MAQPSPKAVDKEDLRQRLSPLEWQVTQEGGTERPFTGRYWDHHGEGQYRCVVCEAPLFASATKYDSRSGWPSFWAPQEDRSVRLLEDRTHGMVRTEVRCATCDAHLGHLFDDGPQPTGQRYCINGAALRFEGEEQD
jgi:peptide-methionine (R)-S-oxide reductase